MRRKKRSEWKKKWRKERRERNKKKGGSVEMEFRRKSDGRREEKGITMKEKSIEERKKWKGRIWVSKKKKKMKEGEKRKEFGRRKRVQRKERNGKKEMEWVKKKSEGRREEKGTKKKVGSGILKKISSGRRKYRLTVSRHENENWISMWKQRNIRARKMRNRWGNENWWGNISLTPFLLQNSEKLWVYDILETFHEDLKW